MPEGGVDNPDVDVIPALKVTTERKQEEASEEKDQGSNEYYNKEFKKGFNISDEITNANELLTTHALEGVNWVSDHSQSFGVALAGNDKKLVISLSASVKPDRLLM